MGLKGPTDGAKGCSPLQQQERANKVSTFILYLKKKSFQSFQIISFSGSLLMNNLPSYSIFSSNKLNR